MFSRLKKKKKKETLVEGPPVPASVCWDTTPGAITQVACATQAVWALSAADMFQRPFVFPQPSYPHGTYALATSTIISAPLTYPGLPTDYGPPMHTLNEQEREEIFKRRAERMRHQMGLPPLEDEPTWKNSGIEHSPGDKTRRIVVPSKYSDRVGEESS
jgi:hypothetical protein